MSELCQRCGPNPQECPIVLCTPCAIEELKNRTIVITEVPDVEDIKIVEVEPGRSIISFTAGFVRLERR